MESKCLMLIEKGDYVSTLSLFNFRGSYIRNKLYTNQETYLKYNDIELLI